MIEDEQPIEPTGHQPAKDAAGDPPPARRKDADTAVPEGDPAEPIETADKTDMSAVGDDGQVFGG
jgi:hypothetical protein